MDRISRGVLAAAFSLGFVALASGEASAQAVDEAASASPGVTIEIEGVGADAAPTGEAILEAVGDETEAVGAEIEIDATSPVVEAEEEASAPAVEAPSDSAPAAGPPLAPAAEEPEADAAAPVVEEPVLLQP